LFEHAIIPNVIVSSVITDFMSSPFVLVFIGSIRQGKNKPISLNKQPRFSFSEKTGIFFPHEESEMLKYDIRRTYEHLGGNTVQRVLGCARAPGLLAVAVYRFGRWLSTQPLPVRVLLKPFFAVFSHRIRAAWGIELDLGAVIGNGLLIFHYGGIFVGSQVIIGDNCSISHDVTIGLAGRGARRGAPTIGNNVYIAPGAKVSGRIKVGNNVKIGANAVVEKDVPDNTLVQVGQVRLVTFREFYKQGDHAGRETSPLTEEE
jgi:serine O-acetyltransferase